MHRGGASQEKVGWKSDRIDSQKVYLTVLAITDMGQVHPSPPRGAALDDAYVLPQTIRPYCKKGKNKALYKQIKTSNGSKFLILKNIPHVLANFLESLLRWYFQVICSSRRRPKNLTNYTLLICLFPISISDPEETLKDE